MSRRLDDSGCSAMDDSLTDMQWLQRMDNHASLTGLEPPPPNSTQKSEKDARNKDGCRKKLEYSSKRNSRKPPLSYASLISLAISSTPQKMMTLSAIYHWIENNFPFYRSPEARAWKNSIRHNLSIRKGMFTKVHQYPPRRGNGSYWTLLAEGEEELKRAVPLFSTLQPPIIDEQSVYNHMPSTYRLKSKGQFVPVAPSSPMKPYFAIGTPLSHPWAPDHSKNPTSLAGSEAHYFQISDVDTPDSHDNPTPHLHGHASHFHDPALHLSDVSCSTEEEEEEEEGSPVLKRRKRVHSLDSASPSPATKRAHNTKSHDLSLDLLSTSFLSPVKDFFADVDLDPISLSPLFSIISPKHPPTNSHPKHCSPPLPSSLTPVRPHLPMEGDSGVFSPLRLEGLMFSTPLRSSDVACDIPLPSALDLPHCSEDVFPSIRGGLGTLCPPTELLGSVLCSPWGEKQDPEGM